MGRAWRTQCVATHLECLKGFWFLYSRWANIQTQAVLVSASSFSCRQPKSIQIKYFVHIKYSMWHKPVAFGFSFIVYLCSDVQSTYSCALIVSACTFHWSIHQNCLSTFAHTRNLLHILLYTLMKTNVHWLDRSVIKQFFVAVFL